jgi:hypothetical protein
VKLAAARKREGQYAYEQGKGWRRTLVRSLTESGKSDTAVKRPESLFAKDEVQRMGSVTVLGNVERVGHRVNLGLETDLDDLHRADDENGFRHSGSETSCDEEGEINVLDTETKERTTYRGR